MAVQPQLNAGDIEAIVCRLKGIIAVSVVTDTRGDLAEIHVLAEGGRAPKQVVRDVESAVMARLGIAIDHKKISVAQVEDASPRYDHSRLKFADVSISLNGSHAEATVRLAKDGAVFSGTAGGAGSQMGQMKLISQATLRAIDDSGLASTSMTLEDVQEVTLGSRRVAVVIIGLAGDRGEDLLSGSALIKQDIWKGVVNATLDAVNRRLLVAHDR